MREPSGADGVLMSSAAGAHIHPRLGLRQSRRLLRLASDERLVQQIQRGSEPAFEVAFERHSPAILGFCRHMLGSQEEAEDAVQHTFAAAYSDLQRGGEREIALKPWLFTIARNRCLSLLRARREHASAEPELVTTGLAEQVEQRAELRQLLADLRELPDEQREALLLAEAGGLPQADIAAILGCEVGRVKGLVYRARSGLLARREARELACEDVREQLANLRGGALRRNELRLHLRDCAGCRRLSRAGARSASDALGGAAGGATGGPEVERAGCDRDRRSGRRRGRGWGCCRRRWRGGRRHRRRRACRRGEGRGGGRDRNRRRRRRHRCRRVASRLATTKHAGCERNRQEFARRRCPSGSDFEFRRAGRRRFRHGRRTPRRGR